MTYENYLENLFREPSDKEETLICTELALLERMSADLREALARLSRDEVHRRISALNAARLSSSNTLLELGVMPAQLMARSRWDQANQLVETWIAQDEAITFERVALLNGLLTRGEPCASSPLRTESVFSGSRPYADAEFLELLVAEFEKRIFLSPVQPRDGTRGGTSSDAVDVAWRRHPAWLAALARYALVSAHPFQDGNGRTSTLVGDWILMKHGFPPFCFLEIEDGTVAYMVDGPASATPTRAFLRSAQGIRKAFVILLDREASEPS